MSDETNNPHAFPYEDAYPSNEGMTLRDYFAAKFLQGTAAYSPSVDVGYAAERAYEAADAMLKARET